MWAEIVFMTVLAAGSFVTAYLTWRFLKLTKVVGRRFNNQSHPS